jgi:3-oxoacyl-[acyl-carrier-protein] synthase II
MNTNDETIAITGYGSVSPLGSCKQEILNSYKSNNHCLSLKKFDDKNFAAGVLSENTEASVQSFLEKNPKLKKLDRVSVLAVMAATQAYTDAKWGSDKSSEIAINIGSSRGATSLFEKYYDEFLQSGKKKVSLYTSPLTTLGNVSSSVANHLSLNGPVISHSMTCSTSLQSMANAVAWLKAGMAERFLAGGSEAPLTSFTIAQLESLGIYSKQSNHKFPCRPLANEENPVNTMVLGEGACVFALEKLQMNKAKNKKIYAIIESIGNGFEHTESPTSISHDGKAFYTSMHNAIKSMITNTPVDLILMHAPGSINGDKAEMNAIEKIFRNSIPPIYSNKWKIGHTYGTSGALSLELALLLMNENITLNTPYTSVTKNIKKQVKKVLVNAAGFGGNAVSVIISHPSVF